MVSDLLCLYCGSQAFAVLDIEINPGRARWPICTSIECFHKAHTDAAIRFATAVEQAKWPEVEHTDAIDVDSRDEDPRRITKQALM